MHEIQLLTDHSYIFSKFGVVALKPFMSPTLPPGGNFPTCGLHQWGKGNMRLGKVNTVTIFSFLLNPKAFLLFVLFNHL